MTQKKSNTKADSIIKVGNHIAKHFWKYIAIIIILGLSVGGYSLSTKWFSCTRESMIKKGVR